MYSEGMLCGCKFQFRPVLSQRLLPMGFFCAINRRKVSDDIIVADVSVVTVVTVVAVVSVVTVVIDNS